MPGAGVQGPLWEVSSLQAVRRGTGAVKGLETTTCRRALIQKHKGSRAVE